MKIVAGKDIDSIRKSLENLLKLAEDEDMHAQIKHALSFYEAFIEHFSGSYDKKVIKSITYPLSG